MGYVSEKFTPGFRLIDGNQLNALVSEVNSGPGSGPTYYVNETKGSDNLNNTGQNPKQPLATLDRALAIESAALSAIGLSSVGRNAIVAFWGTQHRTATLVWNLPATHLVGIASTQLRGKRARISVTGSTGFNKLVQVTAQGCQFENFGTFYGWPNSSAALINWSDEAGRSMYNNVEFLGFGDATVSTGTANLTGARAFVFNNSTGETTWQNCVFGDDTTTRNATNYTVEIAGNGARLSMIDCVFEAYLGSSGTASSHILIQAAGMDRYLDLVRCRFHGDGSSGASTMAQALNVSVSAGGNVLLDSSSLSIGITAWQTTPTTNVQMNMTAPSSGGGKAITVA
jgi:hypothetical protein